MPSNTLAAIAALPNLFLAWKKTRSHVRGENWYYDPLEIELFEQNLESRLCSLSEELLSGEYGPRPAYLIPAPKRIGEGGDAEGTSPKKPAHLDRPLAHCALDDQVVWTAIVVQIADTFEDSFQSPDPAHPTNLSFGNRLFRVPTTHHFRFTQENARLYRQYYDDYSQFLKRSFRAAEEERQHHAISLYELDIKGYYDNIRCDRLLNLLAQKIPETDVTCLLERLLARWTLVDCSGVSHRAPGVGIPQGLVAAHFLGNVYLNPLDHWARRQMGTSGSRLLHYLRYVDDIRVVIQRVGRPPKRGGNVIESIERYLKRQLGLELNREKLKPAAEGDAGSGPITQDQLAIRVSQIDWRTSHLLTTEDAREAASDLETIAYLDFDNVAMKKGSRQRFAANRLVRVWRTFASQDPEFWQQRASRARKWLLSEWSADPSQRALLLKYLDLTPPSALADTAWRALRNVSKIDERDVDSAKKDSWQHYLKAAIYHYLYQRAKRGDPAEPSILKGKRLGAQISADTSPDLPWYVRRAAYLLGSAWTSADSPLATDDVRHAANQEADARVREAQLACLYAGLDDLGAADMLLQPSSESIDVLLYCRRFARVGEIADGDVAPLRQILEERSASMCRAVANSLSSRLTQMDAQTLNALARAGLERAQAVLSQTWHSWEPSGHHAFLAQNEGYQCYEAQVAEGYVSWAQACEKGLFRDEIRLASHIRALACEPLLTETPEDERGAGMIHPGNVFVRFTAGVPAAPPELRVVPIASDDLYRDSSSIGQRSDPAAFTARWWQTGLALCALAGAKGSCSFSSDFSTARKFSTWLSYSRLAEEGAQLSSSAAHMLRQLLSWQGWRKGNWSIAAVATQCDVIVDELGPLRVAGAGGASIQIVPVSLGTGYVSPLRVGMLQAIVDHREVGRGSYSEQTSLNMEKDLRRLVRTAIERGQQIRGGGQRPLWDAPPIHLLVIPELCCPLSCLCFLRDCARRYRMTIVAGLEYQVDGAEWRNELVLLVPQIDAEGGARDVIELYQPKLFPTVGERSNARAQQCDVAPGTKQFLVEDGGVCAWAALDCYDFTCIELRQKLRGRTDLLIVSALNQDLTTFDHLAEASIRDLHTYLVVANTGEYGGSQIIGPLYRDYRRRLFRVEGQYLDTVEVRPLDVDALRASQKEQLTTTCPAPAAPEPPPEPIKFKSIPAGYQMSEWRQQGTQRES
jgi:hypothetical protein